MLIEKIFVQGEFERGDERNRFLGELQALLDKYGVKMVSVPWFKIDRYLVGKEKKCKDLSNAS